MLSSSQRDNGSEHKAYCGGREEREGERERERKREGEGESNPHTLLEHLRGLWSIYIIFCGGIEGANGIRTFSCKIWGIDSTHMYNEHSKLFIHVSVPCCRHRWPVGCYGNTSFLCRVRPSITVSPNWRATHHTNRGCTLVASWADLSLSLSLSLTHTHTHTHFTFHSQTNSQTLLLLFSVLHCLVLKE